jgi:microcin C transport system ATP-binding protein
LLDHDLGFAEQRSTSHKILSVQQLNVKYPIRRGFFNRIQCYTNAAENKFELVKAKLWVLWVKVVRKIFIGFGDGSIN